MALPSLLLSDLWFCFFEFWFWFSLTHPVSWSDKRFLFGSQFVQQVVGHLHASGPQFSCRTDTESLLHLIHQTVKQQRNHRSLCRSSEPTGSRIQASLCWSSGDFWGEKIKYHSFDCTAEQRMTSRGDMCKTLLSWRDTQVKMRSISWRVERHGGHHTSNTQRTSRVQHEVYDP